MTPRTILAGLLLALAACAPNEESHSKSLIGAVLIDGRGGPPVSNSIVVVSGGRIAAAGPRTGIPIPAEGDKIDGSGKVIVPAPVDVCDRAQPAALVRAASAAEAGRRVAELAAGKPAVIYLAPSSPEAAEAALEAARGAGIPVLAWCAKQAEARLLVDHGAAGLIGGIRDTEDLDPALVARMRDLRIVVAPSLLHAGAALETAKRNTLRIFQAGVPIAAASEGGDLQRELELLSEAGIPPLDVIVAATRNGAAALHESDRGTIEAGKRADLLLLSSNPGEDIGNLRRVVLRLR